VTVKRALISVSDKTGLLELAHGLVELGVELIATTGTAAYLGEHNLTTTRVEDLTGVAEMLGGRVKTLHPSVHGALLARRDNEGDQASLAEHGIEPIDLVIVNLYPFRHVAARRESSEGDVVEAIDIGGPAMVRAAAKNFAAVAVLVDPERYGFVLDELRESAGDLSLDTRRELAAEAFAHTAGYDIAIANWFSDTESFPERHLSELVKVTDLAYGENPHQRAAYYMDAGARRHLLSMVTQHGGKQLSFNNLLDLDAATTLAQEFTVPACVIVKHGNPCGVALAATPEEAYRKALAADPASAFGGVVAVNRPLSRDLAELIAEQFVEVLHAPGYGEGAVDLLRERLKNLRLLESDERRRPTPGERDFHRVLGGLLIQDRDTESEDRDTMEVVAGAAPTEREWGDLLFAWRVVKHVRSNAIVIARDTATVGIGAGQMSRIDSTKLALGKALSPVAGAVLASDAFFPFADGVQAALDAGVRVIIEPGGSKRDDEVIAAVEAAGGTLVFTGRRHFSH
jgi:phosphoribosylaminoimidazolecarboxamide formyltransferase/IMP cyclohydrolase